MPTPLDSLSSLSLNAQDPYGVVAARRNKEKALVEMQRALEMEHQFPGVAFAGGSHAEEADLQRELDDDSNFGTDQTNRVNDVLDTNADMATYNRPDVTEKRRGEFADKLALISAPAEIAAKGNLAVENAKTEGVLREKNAQTDATQKLLQAIGGGSGGASSGLAGPGGHIKPTINASGGVSFTTTPMPALVQRARNQLMDARDKTLNALAEAEKQYQGINDEAEKSDIPGGSAIGRLFSGLTGIGAQKYGGPVDRANAGIERGNYSLGIPTPFANLAQEASFGNIEQMAGQLPGVRGLATITPLFKEHQSRWGHETPLATVQRLRHMARMMDETLNTLDTSGAGEPEQ